MKFNKLNFMGHVAGTKLPLNWCCTVTRVSVHTREHVTATFSCMCTCCDFVPAPCPRHTFLLHVASVCITQFFCPCNITPGVWPPIQKSLKNIRQPSELAAARHLRTSCCIVVNASLQWWIRMTTNAVLSWQ